MNHTIETILDHRSVRKFKDIPLEEETVEMLVRAAQAASTSSFVQAYTIIGIEDPVKKRKLADLAGGQPYVEKNGYFFLFCADYHRHEELLRTRDTDINVSTESTEGFMVAVIDAALAAQNMAVAAESSGLGICYIGGIRNKLPEVDALIETPDYVLPLFGMAVGYPEKREGIKPRLPLEAVFHKNQYSKDKAALSEAYQAYDEIIKAYYQNRSSASKSMTWTDQMQALLERSKRQYMKTFVQSKQLDRH
ncbi:FMN reductase (NADPH) [Sinobaca qinghaiensis]|uniref:FMN reductase (NADPH) n=1 Tax=Sinobaca qinghaiensis TaxID=342944 RepID=A0A419V2L8_9BACL|nr:oxygen-insensitive NADPH nitroreductase [Sinobaca qinghaiensis]RKD72773.1 FMN reductase (NADPH) [Sinobaca qinghaiensis]